MNDSTLTSLRNDMEYPSFFKPHIEQVIESFLGSARKCNESVAFVFITDVHIHLNGRASVPLIVKIGEETGVKTVLCGGDHCWAYGSKSQCLADFEDSLRYMEPIRNSMNLYHARGNHDCTVKSSAELDTGYTMPYEQAQRVFSMCSSTPNGAVENKLYYYADDSVGKVRYVVLDTSEHHCSEETAWGVRYGMDAAQLKWLAEVALILPDDDWAVVVMGHVPCTAEMPSYSSELDDLRLILEAFKNKTACEFADFRNAVGELVAYLCGHNHKDRSCVINGVLHISTGCDAYCKDDNLSRDVGRVENALFDLFLLDKETRVLRAFRIGAGSNREFVY